MTVQRAYEVPATDLLLGGRNPLLTAMALNNDVTRGPDGQWLGRIR